MSQLCVALEAMCIERGLRSNDRPDLFECLERAKRIQITEDGDRMYDVCDVLEAVAECGILATQDSAAAETEDDEGEAVTTPEYREAIQPDFLQIRASEGPRHAAAAKLATIGESWPHWSRKANARITVRPLTPEPKCGYSQKTRGSTLTTV